jgi:hypothetical protein
MFHKRWRHTKRAKEELQKQFMTLVEAKRESKHESNVHINENVKPNTDVTGEQHIAI